MGAKQIELEKLTKVYLKIKDRRNELSRQFKDEDGDLKEQQETIKRALLDHCKEQKAKNVVIVIPELSHQLKPSLFNVHGNKESNSGLSNSSKLINKSVIPPDASNTT